MSFAYAKYQSSTPVFAIQINFKEKIILILYQLHLRKRIIYYLFNKILICNRNELIIRYKFPTIKITLKRYIYLEMNLVDKNYTEKSLSSNTEKDDLNTLKGNILKIKRLFFFRGGN